MQLKPFTWTIRIFDPGSGETLQERVLPVHSPDDGHAAAWTLANAIFFTATNRKRHGGVAGCSLLHEDRGAGLVSSGYQNRRLTNVGSVLDLS
jgi:hypothetical protein